MHLWWQNIICTHKKNLRLLDHEDEVTVIHETSKTTCTTQFHPSENLNLQQCHCENVRSPRSCATVLKLWDAFRWCAAFCNFEIKWPTDESLVSFLTVWSDDHIMVWISHHSLPVPTISFLFLPFPLPPETFSISFWLHFRPLLFCGPVLDRKWCVHISAEIHIHTDQKQNLFWFLGFWKMLGLIKSRKENDMGNIKYMDLWTRDLLNVQNKYNMVPDHV